MNSLRILDLKAFVPALNFESSKQFYSALGCDLQYEAEKLAVFELGNCGAKVCYVSDPTGVLIHIAQLNA